MPRRGLPPRPGPLALPGAFPLLVLLFMGWSAPPRTLPGPARPGGRELTWEGDTGPASRAGGSHLNWHTQPQAVIAQLKQELQEMSEKLKPCRTRRSCLGAGPDRDHDQELGICWSNCTQIDKAEVNTGALLAQLSTPQVFFISALPKVYLAEMGLTRTGGETRPQLSTYRTEREMRRHELFCQEDSSSSATSRSFRPFVLNERGELLQLHLIPVDEDAFRGLIFGAHFQERLYPDVFCDADIHSAT
ncbi:chondroitin sulfate N-acetylgalactosaminyltransferase 2 [Lates japonicus]|uniref:Chondroitin sulfate N-acetylgalactosaminyltransferase 2 n=1 Tax=Lates japonicus TaxID=270547 RepID=A0AAD3ML03_LATJO|nr:chondroitin sulfate N-acetylgalactosaminyltransferase 2 [Lates japonicus]